MTTHLQLTTPDGCAINLIDTDGAVTLVLHMADPADPRRAEVLLDPATRRWLLSAFLSYEEPSRRARFYRVKGMADGDGWDGDHFTAEQVRAFRDAHFPGRPLEVLETFALPWRPLEES